MVCSITSRKFIDTHSIALENDDLEIGLLPERSLVKTHKLFTVHQGIILKKFGTVYSEYFEKILAQIHTLIELE
jgi:hypothetical protein